MASSNAPAMLMELGYPLDEASVTAEIWHLKQNLRTISADFPDADEIGEISDVESCCSDSASDTDSLSDCSTSSDADVASVVRMIPVRPAAQPPVVIRAFSHRRFLESTTQGQTPSAILTDASNSAASAAEDGGITPRVSFIDVGDSNKSADEDEDIPWRVTLGSGPGSRVPLSALAAGFASLWLRSHRSRC